MIIQCPRCETGKMDSEKGEMTACWFCSNTVACYVCDGPQCGAKLCATDIEKMNKKKSEPPKPIPFRRGEIGDGS